MLADVIQDLFDLVDHDLFRFDLDRNRIVHVFVAQLHHAEI